MKNPFDQYFFNLNFSITMASKELTFCSHILDKHLEEIVSQIFHLRLISYFMPKIGKLFEKSVKIIF